MRALIIFGVAVLLTGCSFFDRLDLGRSQQLDPNKVYLGRTRLDLGAHDDRSRYGCVGGPMLCVQRGASFDCSCR